MVTSLFSEKLNGKVIWITGASSGIGEALACASAKYNVKLVLSARRENELNRVKSKCLELNKNLTPLDILILPLDITKTNLHKSCFDLVIEQFGNVSSITFIKCNYNEQKKRKADQIIMLFSNLLQIFYKKLLIFI